jgi:hypothetical protein
VKRLAVLALLLVPICAHAASFSLGFLMPRFGNADTSCVTPNLVALENTQLRGHHRWWVAGGDSLGGAIEDSSGVVAPGTLVVTPVYSGISPNAILRARAWATDAFNTKSCDTTITFLPFRVRPWNPHRVP